MSTEEKKPDHTAELRARIDAHRRENASRRARAFVDAPERVLGVAVRPVTPATWTLLQATGNRLLSADTPLEGDVRNFVWFHSSLYMPERWWTVHNFARWLALLPMSARLHSHKGIEWYCACVALAAADARRILHEAVVDSGGGEGRSGRAPGACLEGQMVHSFSKEYGWTREQIRQTPIAQLMQFRRSFDGEDTDDPVERDIRFDHLRRRNAEMAAAREAAKPLTPVPDAAAV